MKSDDLDGGSLDSEERLLVEEDYLKESIDDLLGTRQKSFNQKDMKAQQKLRRQNTRDSNLI